MFNAIGVIHVFAKLGQKQINSSHFPSMIGNRVGQTHGPLCSLCSVKVLPNVKLSAFPETTYKQHGTPRIQEVSAVSAKDSKTAWRRYSKHVIITYYLCIQTMIFTSL